MRLAVTGRPRVGKTTFAKTLSERTGLPVVHADDFVDMGLPWEELPEYAIKCLPADCIVEGVLVARMLGREGFDPAVVYYCRNGDVPLLPEHVSLARLVKRKCMEWEEETGRAILVEGLEREA